nr:hypothetical protein [Gordonia sp. LAM0048]
MLTLTLAATLLGFVLLILSLITGTVWLAVACIVVCLVGLGFLLVDVFAGRKGEAGRSLEDMVPGAGRDPADSDVEREPTDDVAADAPTRRYPVSGAVDSVDDGPDAYRPGSFEPGMAAPEGSVPPGRPAPERREGNLADYLRSVGADAPSADNPVPSAAPDDVRAPGGISWPPAAADSTALRVAAPGHGPACPAVRSVRTAAVRTTAIASSARAAAGTGAPPDVTSIGPAPVRAGAVGVGPRERAGRRHRRTGRLVDASRTPRRFRVSPSAPGFRPARSELASAC